MRVESYTPLQPAMQESLELISRHRLVPSVVIEDARDARPLADALLAGGLPLVEVTLRTPESLAAIERIIERHDMIVGVGTVTTLSQFDAAWRMGARFITTPGMDDNLIRHARRREILLIPGVATPTEIMSAQNMGLDVVKFYHCACYGGLAAIEAMSGPFPKMRFLPTGGLNLTNVGPFLQNRRILGCGGSWMARQEWIKNGQWENVRTATAESVKLARA